MIPTLQTQRLLLRPWRKEDIEPYSRMCADPRTMRYMRTGVMSRQQTEEQIGMLLRHWEEHGHGLWAVEERNAGRFVGRVGLMRREDWPVGPHKVEAGWLIDRPLWGEGLAPEAARATISWGLEELREEAIISIIRPENSASQRVAEKCGLYYRGEAVWKGAEWAWYSSLSES